MRDLRRTYPWKTETGHQHVLSSNPGKPDPFESGSPTKALPAAFRNSRSVALVPRRKGALGARVLAFPACRPLGRYPPANLLRGLHQTALDQRHRSRQTSGGPGPRKRLTKECLLDRWLETRLSPREADGRQRSSVEQSA